MAPWADVLYAADFNWWQQYNPPFEGLRFTADDSAAPWPGVFYVEGWREFGLCRDPKAINTGTFPVERNGKVSFNGGGNSGYQAINLARHLSGGRTLLLGYDMQAGASGEAHWHPDHSSDKRFVNPSDVTFGIWQSVFPALAEDLEVDGIEVINCSRETALTCFPRGDLREML